MSGRQNLLCAVTTVSAGDAQNGCNGVKTIQVWGQTTAGAGAATVQIRGSNNGGQSWDVLATVSLTLSTTMSSDSFTSSDGYAKLQGNVTAISGTGANVNAAF